MYPIVEAGIERVTVWTGTFIKFPPHFMLA